MNKKVTKWFLLLFALLIPAIGWAQDATIVKDRETYTWDASIEGYVLSDFDATSTDGNAISLVINSELNVSGTDYPVKAIAGGLCNGINLESVRIPGSVQTIGANAFQDCTIGEVYFDGSLSEIDISETAFSGSGTENNPIKIEFNWDYEPEFNNCVTGQVQWTDGIGDWKGGIIRVYDSFADFFQSGYNNIYALNGSLAGEGLWWKVISSKKVTEDLPEWFDGVYELSIDEYITVANAWDPAEVKAVKDDVFTGIGTADEPVELGSSNIPFLKSLGMTFSDGVAQLAGGYFQVIMTSQNYGVVGYYAYNEDADGNISFAALKTRKASWVDETYTDFRLTIDGTQGFYDSQLDYWVDYPVTTVKAGFAEGVKDIVNSVYFYFDQNTPTFEDGSMTGIGSTEAPMMILANYPLDMSRKLSITPEDGVYNLGGGFFYLGKENGEVYYALNGEEYLIVGYDKSDIQYYIDNGWDYSINIQSGFREYYYENGVRKNKVISVTSAKDGAFEGLGTAEAPMETTANPTIFQNLGGDISTGVLASGYFMLARTQWVGNGFNYAKYELVDGAYVLEKPIEKSYEGVTSSDLTLYTQFEDWDAATQTYVITPVSAFKKSAFDGIRDVEITEFYMYGKNAPSVETGAFEGFGATAPLVLSMNGKTFKAMGGTFDENSVGTLADGKFYVGQEDNTYGIKVFYAYGEDANGNTIYNAFSSEKQDCGDDYNYKLFIRNDFNEYDAETQQTNYYYVTGIKAGAFGDDVKGVVKGVELYAENLTSVDATAFSGFGTANAPLEIEGNIATISKLANISDDGLIALGGGNFKYMFTTYCDGITVKHLLTSNLEDTDYTNEKIAELTVTGYEQDNGYSNPTISILGSSGYSAGNGDDYLYINLRTTKIAANAFEGIQDVTAVSIDGGYLQEIGENAFAGIGTADAHVPLSISPVLAKRFENQMENGKLEGGYFDIARIQQRNGLNYTYTYVDGAYELSKVEELYSWDSYTAYILTGFQDCGDEQVEFTDINGNTYNTNCPITYVTKVKAGAIPAALAAKITNINVNDSWNNTKLEFEDGVFTGIGSVESPASFLAKTAQTQAIIGDQAAEGIYDIKGGLFAMKAITIKAQKNTNGRAYAITNAEGRTENGSYATLINWNSNMSPEMMKAPSEGSEYYTYTFLGASTITYLQIYEADEYEENGEKWRNYRKEDYRTRQALDIDRDTTFIWSPEKNRLLLEGAPLEYDIYVAGEMVTEDNAADVLSYDPNNAGKVKYDAETNTLTLDGINVTDYSGYQAIRNDLADGLKIVVNGDNFISGGWPMSYFGAKTTIEGDGTLNFNYQNGNGDSDCRIDIQADLTIKDITLNSTGAYYGFRGNGTLTVENAVINVEEVASQNGFALRLGGLILNGAAILAPEGAAFMDGEDGKGVYDADGHLARSLYIGEPAAFTVAVNVLNLDEDKTERAILSVENSGAVSGIALPADMAGANFSIVLPDKVTTPDRVEVAINAVAANAFAGKNLKQIQLPLNNGFVHIGTGAVSSTTKILAPVGYLKNYKELASIADNVTSELLVGYLPTDQNVTTLGVEVTVRADASAKYYLAVFGEDNASIVGNLYEDELIPEMSGLIVETGDDVTGIELVVVADYADNTAFIHNMLCPVFADTDLSNDDGNYILDGDEFKRASTLNSPILKAGHAYLYDPTASLTSMKLTLNGGSDTPTDINKLSVDDENGEWYSINGQRINKPTRKGVYIKNRKKVTIK